MMPLHKAAILLTTVLSIASFSGMAAQAQSAGAKAAVMRHQEFERLGKAFKAINDELKQSSPDKAVLAGNAATMKRLADQAPSWFPKGSGKEAYPKSQALPLIWSDAAGFNAALNRMQQETAKLSRAATAGDIAAVRAQLKPTADSCGGCHRTYREKKS